VKSVSASIQQVQHVKAVTTFATSS